MAPTIHPQKVFPKSSSPKMINIEWVRINLDIIAPAILRKMGSISPCFTDEDTNGPKNIPQEFFPKCSSPQIINIEWVQINLDIMAPAILRKMGSISPCFTHKPNIILPKFFPNNSSPQIITPKLWTLNGCKL